MYSIHFLMLFFFFFDVFSLFFKIGFPMASIGLFYGFMMFLFSMFF